MVDNSDLVKALYQGYVSGIQSWDVWDKKANVFRASKWLTDHDTEVAAKAKAEQREADAVIAETRYFGEGNNASLHRWGSKQAAVAIRRQDTNAEFFPAPGRPDFKIPRAGVEWDEIRRLDTQLAEKRVEISRLRGVVSAVRFSALSGSKESSFGARRKAGDILRVLERLDRIEEIK